MTGSMVHYEVQNAPSRSPIFKIFFASGRKGALTPLTKILRTPLVFTEFRQVLDVVLFRAGGSGALDVDAAFVTTPIIVGTAGVPSDLDPAAMR